MRHRTSAAIRTSSTITIRRLEPVRWLILAASCIALAACQSLETFVDARPTRSATAPISPATQSWLHLNAVRWRDGHCLTLLEQLREAPGPFLQKEFALAELNLRSALTSSCRLDRRTALLDAARASWRILQSPDTDHRPASEAVLRVYNQAVAALATSSLLAVHVDQAAPAARELHDTTTLRVRGLIERHRRPGLGAALLGVIPRDPTDPERRHYYARGAAMPLTALVDFATTTPTLQLHDSTMRDALQIGAVEWPLHADFTVPYAYTQTGTRWRRRGFMSAFSPQDYRALSGIYLVEPYRPDRIPLLMIHGIAAGPQAWRNITNEILGTDDLRRRFQVWHYFYPSGQPFLLSAFQLRSELAALRSHLAQRTGKPVPRLVVIGHSQGGLIAQALANQPGEALWRTIFSVPPEKLSASPDMFATVDAILRYAPTADIDRIVFMETPHRGSEESQRSVGVRILELFMGKSDSMRRQIHALQQAVGPQLTPYGLKLARRGGINAADSLSASSPLMQAFAAAPLSSDIHYHSIIAIQDEYVDPGSANLPQAESVLEIPARHQDTDNARTFAELARILRLAKSSQP